MVAEVGTQVQLVGTTPVQNGETVVITWYKSLNTVSLVKDALEYKGQQIICKLLYVVWVYETHQWKGSLEIWRIRTYESKNSR